jgi:uncharacterized membrane protein YhiD involved in acid resistance
MRQGVGKVTPAAADVIHLLVAAALTYALGFERDVRGALAGDRLFALIGVGAVLHGRALNCTSVTGWARR